MDYQYDPPVTEPIDPEEAPDAEPIEVDPTPEAEPEPIQVEPVTAHPTGFDLAAGEVIPPDGSVTTEPDLDEEYEEVEQIPVAVLDIPGYDPPEVPEPVPGGPGYPVGINSPLSGEGWNFAPPEQAIQLRIQEALAMRGRYPGKLNGEWGNFSVYGIQKTVSALDTLGWNFSFAPGVPSRELCILVQRYATEFGGFVGLDQDGTAVEGILGPNAWLCFARGLEAGL